jgi:hypothetical protein
MVCRAGRAVWALLAAFTDGQTGKGEREVIQESD